MSSLTWGVMKYAPAMIDDNGSKVNLSFAPHLLQRAAQLIVADVGQVVDGFDDRVEDVGAGGEGQLQIGQKLFGVTGFRVGPSGRNQCVGDAQQYVVFPVSQGPWRLGVPRWYRQPSIR